MEKRSIHIVGKVRMLIKLINIVLVCVLQLDAEASSDDLLPGAARCRLISQ